LREKDLKEKNYFLRVILDEETRVLDDRLLCMKIEVKKKRIRLNACINGEWGSEGFVKHKWKNGRGGGELFKEN